ncbi:tetratricopeptide repeat protein [Rhodoblastus sp.]|uniref:tetratricopeptide repeat protein n=1 Tax=Rhodoblastus sp. TaxID=1962975 RepID=UPI0035B215B5
MKPDSQEDYDSNPNLKAAQDLFDSGDEAGSFAAFEVLAEQDSAPAMTWLGYLYLNGKGVTADRNLAHHWFSKAASLGDAEAMDWIGRMHHSGSAGKIDLALARQWSAKAAEAGDAHGQYNLGSMLFAAGEDEEAERWMQKSANQGLLPAIRSTDERRAYEMFQQKRYAEALPLFNRLASDGSAWAQECLGNMYWNGLGVAEDRDQSLRCYEEAYDGGRLDLAYQIGGLHFRAGRPDAALTWWRKDTQWPISSTYWQYRVLRKQPHLAAHPGESDELLKRAAGLGHFIAKRDVAFRMLKGDAAFGSRLQGVGAWLRLIPAMIRLGTVNIDDERLR